MNIKRVLKRLYSTIPFHLSLSLFLVTLGSPPPTVTWLMNGQLQNSVVDYTYDGTINSKLVVRNLSRIHQHAVYTCQASNFHKKYVATNITIELYREYISTLFKHDWCTYVCTYVLHISKCSVCLSNLKLRSDFGLFLLLLPFLLLQVSTMQKMRKF